jgi:hypothetical protein
VGSSVITRHPWVIPVIAYDAHGRPMNFSNVGKAIGTRDLGGPGILLPALGLTAIP